MVVRYTQEELEQMPTDVLDRLAFDCSEGEVLRLPAQRITISSAQDLENPQHRYRTEGWAWAQSVDLNDPVLVTVNDDGEFCLEDGHHRYLAARVRGEPVLAKIQIRGNPVRAILRRQDGDAEQMLRARCAPRPAF